MWYVVQTIKGKEQRVLDEIKEHVIQGREEAFILFNEKMYKHQGKWHAEQENLFAGYLFVDTDEPKKFDERLHKQNRTLRFLRVNDEITAIYEDEMQRLMLLGGEEHIVRYSEGFRDGDEVRITSGALKGFNGRIKKLDRHNRQAVITLSLFGRETDVTLGLGIVKSA